jgi:major histocompatibility complex class I
VVRGEIKKEIKHFLEFKKILTQKLGVVVHVFNPSTREAEAGGFLSSRPAWSTK